MVSSVRERTIGPIESLNLVKGEEMSGTVSRGQALQVSARVATQINWDELDGDALQAEVIQLPPEEFGSKFTDFLKTMARVRMVHDYFQETKLRRTIYIPPMGRPDIEELSAVLQGSSVKIAYDISQTGPIQLALGTILSPEESEISMAELDFRLSAIAGRLLGYQHAQWLVRNQDEYPEFKELTGKIEIIFMPGLEVRVDGFLYFTPALVPEKSKERWELEWIGSSGASRSNRLIACAHRAQVWRAVASD